MYSVNDLLPVLKDVLANIAVQADTSTGKHVEFQYFPSAPENPEYPFVQLGSLKETPLDTDMQLAHEVIFSLELVSRPHESRSPIDLGTYGECIRGCEWVRDGIHRQEQAFRDGGLSSIVEAIWIETNYIREPDTLTYRGIMVFKFLLDS